MFLEKRDRRFSKDILLGIILAIPAFFVLGRGVAHRDGKKYGIVKLV
jgi:hypothetical protein